MEERENQGFGRRSQAGETEGFIRAGRTQARNQSLKRGMAGQAGKEIFNLDTTQGKEVGGKSLAFKKDSRAHLPIE
jgi:hypothetical protein